MSFDRPHIDHPVKHFGGSDEPYDEASAVGWHVTLRDERGELESLAGPFPDWHTAMSAFRTMLATGHRLEPTKTTKTRGE